MLPGTKCIIVGFCMAAARDTGVVKKGTDLLFTLFMSYLSPSHCWQEPAILHLSHTHHLLSRRLLSPKSSCWHSGGHWLQKLLLSSTLAVWLGDTDTCSGSDSTTDQSRVSVQVLLSLLCWQEQTPRTGNQRGYVTPGFTTGILHLTSPRSDVK